MTKIDIVSGFLGAGKTTFIQKMIRDVLHNEKVVLIENEFGEIGIDGGFMKEAGIDIKEMNSGCICCSLVGDFGTSLNEVITQYSPERILIEPSGVGKLSDVMKAVAGVSEGKPEVVMNAAVAVVDVSKAKMYIKNFGEFFINQIENAGTIVLSRTQNVTEEKLTATVELLRQYNEKATIITTPWDEIDGTKILETMESGMTMEEELLAQMKEELEHHHEEHDENCTCGCHDHDHEHHHHDHEDDHDHEHHHHEHEDDHDHEHHHHEHEDDHDHEHHHHDHEHEHHHEHDENCTCGCHDHDHHHHHHHADEVFTSWGFETPKSYSADMISDILDSLEDETKYGFILRAKGMVPDKEGGFLYFDYVPEEKNIRKGAPEVTGKICVIGSKIQEENLKTLFGV